jgi:hypothetical protein
LYQDVVFGLILLVGASGNQLGALRIDSGNGTLDIGAQNAGWAHFNTDRSNFYFNKALHVDGSIGSYNTTDLNIKTGTTTRMTIINSSGNVGIGLTRPGYKLDVNGDVNIAAASALRFGGTSVCTSAGCTAVSDVRLKENIQPLENSLEKILQLQGVEYDYRDKAKFGDKHQIGVIAQDTEKVYPEVVVTDKKTGFKAVAYDHLVAPLIEAVKTLYNRIVGLEDNQAAQARQIANVEASNADIDIKIRNLESENAQLKQENKKIKNYLCSKDPQADICK